VCKGWHTLRENTANKIRGSQSPHCTLKFHTADHKSPDAREQAGSVLEVVAYQTSITVPMPRSTYKY
jgi:hypothetical protein